MSSVIYARLKKCKDKREKDLVSLHASSKKRNGGKKDSYVTFLCGRIVKGTHHNLSYHELTTDGLDNGYTPAHESTLPWDGSTDICS